MPAAPLHLANHRLALDPLGALVWRQAGILALADAIFDTASLQNLGLLLRRWEPQTLLFLGGGVKPSLARQLAWIIGERQLIWVGEDFSSPPMVGTHSRRIEKEGLVFSHRPGAAPTNRWRKQTIAPMVFGFLRPVWQNPACAAMACFIASPQALVLPQFGGVESGTDIFSPDVTGFFPGGRILACEKNRFRSFTYAQAAPRRPDFEPDLQLG